MTKNKEELKLKKKALKKREKRNARYRGAVSFVFVVGAVDV